MMPATVSAVADCDAAVLAGNGSRALSRPKRWLFRILAVFLGIIVVLVALELILRIVGWPAPGFYVDGRGPIALRRPGFSGGAYPPNTAGRLKTYEYDVGWQVNEDGFRERPTSDKARNEWRIGILGDSFAAGFGVEQADRFSEIWASKLGPHTPNITIWNLATPNCGTLCEAEILERSAQRYSLDEILLVFYGGNDVQDNIEEYHAVNGNGADDPPSGTYRVWLREHSRLASFIWVSAFRAFATIRPPGIYSEKKLQTDWPDTERALARFKMAAAKRRVTVLYIPSLPEWDDESWKELSKYPDVVGDGRFVVKNALKGWAEKNGVSFLDATSWLSACKPSRECVYPVDGHWTPRAHVLAG
ncbi:MAG: GDSL-type esterase/lipase family protein, partial [Pyrinomonadaceae bacterium]